MAISFVGAGSGAGSATVPVHAVGDLIVVCAFRLANDGVIPALAAGFTSITTGGTGTSVWRLAYKIATSTSDTSGTWGSANDVVVLVYRGIDTSDPIGAFQSNAGVSSAGIKYGQSGNMSLDIPGSTSWVVAFGGSEDQTAFLSVTPTSMTLRNHLDTTLSHETGAFDTNAGVATSYPFNTTTAGGAAQYRTVIVEIKALPNRGSLMVTAPSDTISAQGIHDNHGNLTLTLPNDTLTAQGNLPIEASVVATIVGDTLSAQGVADNHGSLVLTLANDSVAATGDLGGYANLALTIPSDSLAAAGELGRYGNTNTVMPSDTLDGLMLHGIVGNLAVPAPNDTIVATGELGRYGNLALTVVNDTIVVTGELGRYGNLSASVVNDTIDAFGGHLITGIVVATVVSDIVSASLGLQEKIASLTATLESDTLVAISLTALSGSVDSTLPDDTLDSGGIGANTADLDATLPDDTLEADSEYTPYGVVDATLPDDEIDSEAELGHFGNVAATLDDDTLDGTLEGMPFGKVIATLPNDTLTSLAGSFITGSLEATMPDDILIIRNTVTESCCTPGLCDLNLDRLVCNYVNALPCGPVWDRAKDLAIDYFRNGATDENSRYSSVANHAVYVAHKLKNVIDNGLNPALRESSPFTAYDTMDDWLDRYGWVDCFYGSCRDMDLGPLTPFEFETECGTIFCEVETPDPLKTAVKHALIVALSRLDTGILATLEQINWVIQPLGAKLVHIGSAEICPIQFNLNPIDDQIGAWSRFTCEHTPTGTVQAWFNPTTCNTAGLQSQIWPAMMSAECIVRSVLQRNTGTIINRRC